MKNKLKFLLGLTLFVTGVSTAQVGIGNTTPKATLDVNKASYTTGEQAGIAITRLTGAQILAMSTTDLGAGTLVYATSTSGAINSTGFWYYDGAAWSKVGGAATTPALNITVPTANDYTVLETDQVIYRNLTAPGFITFPSTLPAGKIFYIANPSGSFDWSIAPTPINAGTTRIDANQSGAVITLGGGNIMVTTGY